MEGGTLLYPEKTDAQVEAELAQTTRQIQMLANGQDSASGAATAAAEDCARAPLACPATKPPALQLIAKLRRELHSLRRLREQQPLG